MVAVFLLIAVSSVQYTYVSNDREHEWYVTQQGTGIHSKINCGPAVAVMAIKWVNPPDYEITVQDAASKYNPGPNGGWHIRNVRNFVALHGVKTTIEKYQGHKTLTDALDKGNIIIVGIDARKINNLYYPPSDAHFIIVKGYRQINDKVVFEVYDPVTWKGKNGKDVNYLAEEVSEAIFNWHENVVVVFTGRRHVYGID